MIKILSIGILNTSVKKSFGKMHNFCDTEDIFIRIFIDSFLKKLCKE